MKTLQFVSAIPHNNKLSVSLKPLYLRQHFFYMAILGFTFLGPR